MLTDGGGGSSAGVYVDHAGVQGMAGTIRGGVQPLFSAKATLAGIMSAAQGAAGEFAGSLESGTDDINSKLGSGFEEIALNIQLQAGFLVSMANAIGATDASIATATHTGHAQ